MKESCHESLKQNIWSSKNHDNPSESRHEGQSFVHIWLEKGLDTTSPHNSKSPFPGLPEHPRPKCHQSELQGPWYQELQFLRSNTEKWKGLMTWWLGRNLPRHQRYSSPFHLFVPRCHQKTTKVESIESGWRGMTNQPWALWFPKPKLPNLGSCP